MYRLGRAQIQSTEQALPLTIAGLKAWYDASDASSFTYSSGTLVSQWNDLSGQGRHISQGSVGAQPSRSGAQNGQSTVVYGAGTSLTVAVAPSVAMPLTTLGVVRWDGGGASNTQWIRLASSQIAYVAGTAYALYGGLVLAGGTPGTTWHQWSLKMNGVTSQIWADGASQATGTEGPGASMSEISVGATVSVNVWRGEVAEVIIYGADLAAADRLALEQYLKNKWATP